jgi:hypothetical protein
MESRCPGKNRTSLLTLLTTAAAEDKADVVVTATGAPIAVHTAITNNNKSNQNQQLQPSLTEGLSLVLEPLQVTTDDVEACPLVANAATTKDVAAADAGVDPSTRNVDCNNPRSLPANRRVTATETTTAAAATATVKYDIRYDPYRLAASATMATKQQQHQAEEYDPSAEQNLYCYSFPHQYQHQFQTTQPQQRYQGRDAPKGDILAGQRVELTPRYHPTRKTTMMDNSLNTDAPLTLDPTTTPVWLNPETGINSTNNRNNKAREAQGRSSSDHQPIINDDDSNPIPIRQQPRFHPVQPLQEFGQEKQKEQQQQLGQSSGLHARKNQRGSIPIATAKIDHGPPRVNDDERRGMVDSFQGRPFYPPQLMIPQPINPHQQQLPLPTNHNFFHRTEPRFHPQQQLPLVVHGNVKKGPPPAVPIGPRGRSPISASFGRDVFAPPYADFGKKKEQIIRCQNPSYLRDGNTKTRKRPWDRRTFPGTGPADASFPSTAIQDTNNDNIRFLSPTPKPSRRNATVTATARATTTTTEAAMKQRQTGGALTYVERVQKMLEEAHKEGFDHIVSWQPHGRAFKIHSPKEFSEKILPRYFNTKLKNFKRTLLTWGFVRHCEGPDRDAFYHRYFVRGIVLSLVSKLTKKELFKSMEGWLSPGEAPNFYLGGTQSEGSSAPGNDADIERTIETNHGQASLEHSHEQDKLGPSTAGNREAGDTVDDKDDKNDEKGMHSDDDDPYMILHENPKLLRGTVLKIVRRMLQEATEKNFTDVISWLPGGKTFKVHNIVAFQKKVCGKYFKSTKLMSFSDSLRKWGFCRLWEASGMERNAYYHCLFQEGKPQLCRHYSRFQMQNAMNDFREEQKRQKEISWSLFPSHREEQRGTATTASENNQKMSVSLNGISGTAKPEKLKNSDALTRRDNLGDGDGIKNCMKEIDVCRPEPLAIEPTAIPHSPPQAKDYYIPYLVLPNVNNENTNGNGAHDGSNSRMRHSYGDNYDIDRPYYHMLRPNTTLAAAAAFPSATNKKDSRPSTVWQPQKQIQKRPQKNKDTGVSYPIRIHMMLEDTEKNGYQHIVSWRSHGRAWKIHDEEAFKSMILPRYFTASTLASFDRWLNHWGFLRVRAGRDRRCWYHRLFVRGVTELLEGFTQLQLFAAMEEWRAPGKEPDLYCSGKGNELSELPSGNAPKRNKHEPFSVNGSNGNNDVLGGLLSATTTTTGSEEAAPPQMQPEKDPRHLRGTLMEKLREMLDVVQGEGKADIASWLPHGKAFMIHEIKVFEETIMHRFFRASKYRYFGDVLRSWGFVIFKNGKDKGAFYHKYFLQNKPRLSLHLSRHQMKESMRDWPKIGIAPDFYPKPTNNNEESNIQEQKDGDRSDDSCSVVPMDANETKQKPKQQQNPKQKPKPNPTRDNKTNLSLGKSPSVLAAPTKQ